MSSRENYNVAIYCRLSKDDASLNIESSSISTQKSMLTKYVKDKDWNIYDLYIDDGWSGTNFNRPDFQRMIEDIEHGKVDLVIVKDLSRLGRNYILTGQYTDIIFPDKNVRFIALDDGVDTLNSNNDIAPFKNILNEMYSKDISKKIRSAVKTKKQQGNFLSNYAPYGYVKSLENKNILVPDPPAATIVKKMFEMAASGMGSTTIAKRLNEENQYTPIEYRNLLLGKPLIGKKQWTATSVLYILRNRIYTGDMVQGIYECSPFKRTPSKRKPQDDWIITLNTHEPLIERKTWEYVQKIVDGHHKVTATDTYKLFGGLLKCGDCGYFLSYSSSRGKEKYSCGNYKRFGKKACTPHNIQKEELEQIILNEIKKCASLAASKRKTFLNRLQTHQKQNDDNLLETLNDNLEKLQYRIDELNRIIKQLYEDKVNGIITDKRFQILLKDFEEEHSITGSKITNTNDSISKLNNRIYNASQWLDIISKYANVTELNREILDELIEKIVVNEITTPENKKSITVSIYHKWVGVINKNIFDKS